MKSIWVAGEVLIDLIPGSAGVTPVVGGGPANTAVALAHLGFETHFIDGMSTDAYGVKAKVALESKGVQLDFVKLSDKPTCTATLVLDSSGSATYEFLSDGTATFDFDLNWLPDPHKYNPSLLHVGTLATVIEPGASQLYEWAREVSDVAPVIYDPNVRPSVMSDRNEYHAEVEKWASIATCVKVSEDDISWLYPGETQTSVAEKWLHMGVALVVITLGSEGLLGITSHGQVKVPALKAIVVDTVGAGDTVGGIIAEAIVEHGILTLHGELLRATLLRAAKAASITCSRAGAQPPTRKELEA